MKTLFGESFYDTLCCMKTLGVCLSGLNKMSEAEAVYRECYDKQKQCNNGIDNYESLSTLLNLAATLGEQKREHEAELLLVECVDKLNKVCGQNHPITIKAEINLGGVYLAQVSKFITI